MTQQDITRLALDCEDGVALRAEMLMPRFGASDAAHRAGVVLCHPHPLHGGNMYSHVIGGLFNELPQHGLSTIRFNFRGTSGSEGKHDGGNAEQLDVLAAVNHLLAEVAADLPIIIVGYSFGAVVGLSAAHPAVVGWVGIAPPLTMAPIDALASAASSSLPKHLIIGSADNFCPPTSATEITSSWAETSVVELPGEDHFLATASRDLNQATVQAISSILGSNPLA